MQKGVFPCFDLYLKVELVQMTVVTICLWLALKKYLKLMLSVFFSY